MSDYLTAPAREHFERANVKGCTCGLCELIAALPEIIRAAKAQAWQEGRRANGYLFGHDYDCAGYSDCYCETYISPYTEESAAIVAFCGDTEQHDSHDVPARGTPDSGWQYLPAHTCPGFFQCDECYEIEYKAQPNHTCQEEA